MYEITNLNINLKGKLNSNNKKIQINQQEIYMVKRINNNNNNNKINNNRIYYQYQDLLNLLYMSLCLGTKMHKYFAFSF